VNVSLDSGDAMELGQLLQFLDDWLAAGHGPVSESLTRFVGCESYDLESLRGDLARFMFLLGESDRGGILLATRHRRVALASRSALDS
jgi:hypothetical protein